MPGSIALTRIHTPEDYWLRMGTAEALLAIKSMALNTTDPVNSKRCGNKAQQLSDRYHEYWTTTRKDYFG